jgi:hypothetical protein
MNVVLLGNEACGAYERERVGEKGGPAPHGAGYWESVVAALVKARGWLGKTSGCERQRVEALDWGRGGLGPCPHGQGYAQAWNDVGIRSALGRGPAPHGASYRVPVVAALVKERGWLGEMGGCERQRVDGVGLRSLCFGSLPSRAGLRAGVG